MEKEMIGFREFNEYGEVRIYEHGVLPHWRQDGCTYFVTFRLADSLPRSVWGGLQDERKAWLRAHGVDPSAKDWKRPFAKLSQQLQREYERSVGAQLNRHLDEGHGECLLRHGSTSDIVAAALDHFHGERVWTGDFVVMPNHVHVLMTPMDGFELEDVLRSIKGFSAKEINHALGKYGTLWQRESYDHIVRDERQLEAFQNYIRDNPAKAGLTEGDYRYASAEYSIEA